jgi:hypothetical protein
VSRNRYAFVRDLTDQEIVDELLGDPPRDRSDAYLEALRREEARRRARAGEAARPAPRTTGAFEDRAE